MAFIPATLWLQRLASGRGGEGAGQVEREVGRERRGEGGSEEKYDQRQKRTA